MSGTYLTLLITVISGAIGAGLSIFALKQSENASLIALAGFIVGIVAFSLSLVYVIQYGVASEKYKTESSSTNTSY
jgi:predicted permease